MGPLDLANHLLNFMAPAVVVGVFLALLGPFLVRKRPGAHVFIAQAAINSIAGVVALIAGLWFFGNDGKMATYAAMLLTTSLAQASSGRWGK